MKVNVEILFRDEDVFINYWECGDSREINCEIKDGTIHKFVYNTSENLEMERAGVEINPFEQVEISLSEFVDMLKTRAEAAEKREQKS